MVILLFACVTKSEPRPETGEPPDINQDSVAETGETAETDTVEPPIVDG